MNTLIVDDKQLAVNALLKIMNTIDYDGNHTAMLRANDALNFLKDNVVDVAFLDIEMPDMNGLELAKRVREISDEINIIFVTGYAEYALKAHELFVSGYLMKPTNEEEVRNALDHLRHHATPQELHQLKIQCFGNFEVFSDSVPLHFCRSKTKELFAYLIDRNGACCTMGEMMGVLWEDKPDSLSQRSQLRNLIHDLKNTLVEVDAEDVILRGHNTLAVEKDMVNCDYYDFLLHLPKAADLFHGEYMNQYSWAETTGASLFMK